MHTYIYIGLIRFIRVFRVVKLFKFNRSLRHLINALTASVLPVINSLIIFFLFTCIYAVLATNIFGRQARMQREAAGIQEANYVFIYLSFILFSLSFLSFIVYPEVNRQKFSKLSSIVPFEQMY